MSKKKFRPLAEAIRWWDKFRYKSTLGASHCYGKFTETEWGMDFIYQATGHGTNFMGQENFNKLNDTKEEYELDLPKDIVLLVGRECIRREGIKYGTRQMVGMVIVNLLTIISFGKINIKNPLADGDDATVCLEEIGTLINKVLKIEVPLDLDSISITPFRDYIASLPISKKVEI
jgi:hypothetical protein